MNKKFVYKVGNNKKVIFDLPVYTQNKDSSIFSTWKQEIHSHIMHMTSCTYDVPQLLQANIQGR